MAEQWPVLLTVEEAGAVLRVGRTKAYALARQWRATGGRSGLPVVDFGHVLRVPRCALEEMIGSALAAEGANLPAGVTQQDDQLLGGAGQVHTEAQRGDGSPVPPPSGAG